jgi:hypothetical protein
MCANNPLPVASATPLPNDDGTTQSTTLEPLASTCTTPNPHHQGDTRPTSSPRREGMHQPRHLCTCATRPHLHHVQASMDQHGRSQRCPAAAAVITSLAGRSRCQCHPRIHLRLLHVRPQSIHHHLRVHLQSHHHRLLAPSTVIEPSTCQPTTLVLPLVYNH